MKKILLSFATVLTLTVALLSWKSFKGGAMVNKGDACTMLVYSTGDKPYNAANVPYQIGLGNPAQGVPSGINWNDKTRDILVTDGVVQEVMSRGGVTIFKCKSKIPGTFNKKAAHYDNATGWDCNDSQQDYTDTGNGTFNTTDEDDWHTTISGDGNGTLTCQVKNKN